MVFSKKNHFLLILILGVALIILSGCGGSSNNTINDVNETNDQVVANNKLDTFLNDWKNEDVLSMGNALSNDFVEIGSDGEETKKDNYILVWYSAFASGLNVNEVTFTNRVNENISPNFIKVSGQLYVEVINTYGYKIESTDSVQFNIEKINGVWYITKIVY